jgi:tetratricopeptide (TPR) repeat protein
VYDRPLRDVFSVQDEIAQAIANELRAGTVPRRPPPTDIEAWQLYQEGRYFFTQFQAPESNYKAIERYNLALARDPNFSLAYAGLSGAYAYLAENFSVAPRDVMPKAKEAAQKAVTLDPESAEAHASLGAVILDYDWDVAAAQRELKTAMELNPGASWAKHWYAHSLEAQDRVEDALAEMRAALALDPLSIAINWDVGSELISLNRLDEAAAHLDKAAELFPASPIIGFLRAEAEYRLGRLAVAHGIIEHMQQTQPRVMEVPFFQALIGTEAVHEGRRDEGLATLARLEALPGTVYVEAFPMIELCSALKDHPCTAKWMQRLVDDRSTLRPYIQVLSTGFLSDPDAAALAAKLPH